MKLKNSESLFNSLITLPLHPDLSLDDIDYIVKNLFIVLNQVIDEN